ncbi:hypothetical protein [Thermovenabulum gondwanense]|uniref:Uncharacterized protein n=1 Tax=Thermovenabulum gondwanense TaxID=520767 RepID=A0A162MJM7_9FIRM|nr:hypothetical protein [Thermovenabulum gondwanense]KYO66376.1 hypothetical protein ATZ99_12580 [Thermovenabulum gondwanense]
MKNLMNYIWLLNACNNSLLEAEILSKQALERYDEFFKEIEGIKGEERDCLKKELENSILYIDEKVKFLQLLSEKLKEVIPLLKEE